MMRRLLGLSAAALTLIGPTPAWACSFVERSVDARFSRADVVFVGTVSFIEGPRGRRDVQLASIAVYEVYKGSVPRTVLVRTATSSKDCGVAFVPGERYSIFGMLVRGDVRTDASGTLFGNAELAASTHEPIARYPANTPSPLVRTDPAASRAGPIAAAMLLILVAGAGHVARRGMQRHNWHPNHAI